MELGHILLVDDDRDARDLFGDLLSDEGYSVATASDGWSALAKLDDFPADLVVTDLQMPGMDGAELIRRVRRQHPESGAVLLTAYRGGDPQRIMERMGADAYLFKPVEATDLVAVVRQVLQARQLGTRTNYMSV